MLYELTQYEAMDLARSTLATSQEEINRALALGTAYLVCAYTAGKNLTTIQVSIVNIGFIFAVGMSVVNAVEDVGIAKRLWVHAGVVPAEALNAVWKSEAMPALLGFGGIVACLFFMWSVRRPKVD